MDDLKLDALLVAGLIGGGVYLWWKENRMHGLGYLGRGAKITKKPKRPGRGPDIARPIPGMLPSPPPPPVGWQPPKEICPVCPPPPVCPVCPVCPPMQKPVPVPGYNISPPQIGGGSKPGPVPSYPALPWMGS